MDYCKVTLTPCSVESIPLGLHKGENNVWPVVVSCYQLQEKDSRRLGHMDVFLVRQEDGTLKLGRPHTVQTETSGILDGKWLPRRRRPPGGNEWWFATARSNGQVQIDAFSFSDESSVTVTHVASSAPSEDGNALCLSLQWDCSSDDTERRILSTYSNGKVAIRKVVPKSGGGAHIVEEECWLAHALFRSTPAEVWTADFALNGTNTILSGGDDAKLKLWDVRVSTVRPSQVLTHFDAGVTVVSTDPAHSHVVAVGSYDESMALYDVRKTSTPLAKSGSLGGGIWRIKWHPTQRNRLLIAAMHGGCRVMDWEGEEFHVTKEFTKHECMAYGADWLVTAPTNGEEAAVSCSFYDQAVFLWETR